MGGVGCGQPDGERGCGAAHGSESRVRPEPAHFGKRWAEGAFWGQRPGRQGGRELVCCVCWVRDVGGGLGVWGADSECGDEGGVVRWVRNVGGRTRSGG